MQPLVSICIPTFNGETYIAEAMESAIAQSYPNLEIVVSDDASTDGTLIVINQYKDRTTIPIYIYNHNPQGIGANWNHCVQKANGNYIKFLFQDDLLRPDCIEKMMTMMLTKASIGMVYSRRKLLFKDLTPKIQEFIDHYSDLHTRWDSLDVKEGVLSGRSYLKDQQLLNSPKNKIGEPINTLIKKDCFDTIGYFNEQMKQTLDSDYWYRVMTRYDIGFIDETLAQFRLHDRQTSALNKKRAIPDQILLYKQYYKHLFWYLHPKNQWKLLKLFHPVFKVLVAIKQRFYAQ